MAAQAPPSLSPADADRPPAGQAGLSDVRTNLPVERGAFVGRRRLLATLADRLRGPQRAVALVGPQGIGKTRLALRAAAHALRDRVTPGGVFVVDLVDVQDARELTARLLQVLGLATESGTNEPRDFDRIAAVLGQREPTLLLADGCDSDTPLRALLELVGAAPPLRVLLTRRVAATGTAAPASAALLAEVAVAPLKLAKQAAGATPRALLNAEAVALFVARAQELVPAYAPSDAELSAAAQIVRLLDGVPLAIEVAAARMRAFTAVELLERLPRRVAMLAPPDVRGAPPRAALSGAVAWSLDQLAPWEQDALAQLAIFRGGFSAQTAARVVDLAAHANAPPLEAVLQTLAERALLVRAPDPSSDGDRTDAVRFAFPLAVREVAVLRARTAIPHAQLVLRHARDTVDAALQWADAADAHGGVAFRARIHGARDNILAAVEGCLALLPHTDETVTLALRGVLALEPALMVHGPIEQLLALATRVLDVADGRVPLPLMVRALEMQARALRARARFDASGAALARARALAAQVDAPLLLARVLVNQGTHALLTGALDAAAALYDAGEALLRQQHERKVYGRSRGFRGLLCEAQGDALGAVALYDEALAIHREVGDARWEGIHAGQRGRALLQLGRLDEAFAALRAAIGIHRTVGNTRHEAQTRVWLGRTALLSGTREEARTQFSLALTLAQQAGDLAVQSLAAAHLAAVLHVAGQLERAGALAASARGLAERHSDPALSAEVAALLMGVPLSRATAERMASP